MKLVLGVIDIPYVQNFDKEPKKIPKAKKGKANKPIRTVGPSGTETTGDVATWLENKYGVMQVFADQQEPAIAQALENSLAGAMESQLMGAPAGMNAFGTAEHEIGQMFRTFLDEEEVAQAGVKGVPTEAAKKGVNHRLKENKGDPRPSFVDTGKYQNSFVAWVE